jgi:hypothetical protein
MIFSAHAEEIDLRTVYGAHPGYVSNVKEEQNKRDIEMVLLEKPKEPKKPPKVVIVDDKLTKEFQEQYKLRFGQTMAEQVINSSGGRNDEYTYYNQQSVNILDYHRYQRQFGEYMGRRLVEYHFDKWAKNDKSIRPIYEMKDKISNLNVKFKKGYKLKWKYSFSGPYMEASLDNPYDIELKIQAQMNGIVSNPEEIVYSAGYPLTPRVRISALYKQYDGLYQIIATRQMTKHITTSITGSTDQRMTGPSVHQNLILFGFGWTE